MNKIFINSSLLVVLALLCSCTQTSEKPTASSGEDRTVLPLKIPVDPTYTELDVHNATPPPRFVVKAPEDAPNVVIVLVDDLGFAGTSKFGGPVSTTCTPSRSNRRTA